MVTYSAKNVNDKTSIRLSALTRRDRRAKNQHRRMLRSKLRFGVFRIANIKITLRIVQNDIEHLYNL